MSESNAVMKAIKDALSDSLIGLFYVALEELLSELDAREAALDAREAALDARALDLERVKQDKVATDISQKRYTPPSTYDKNGTSYVEVEALPDRERHVLATIQVLASSGELLISNADLLQHVRTEFDPVSLSGLTACLTRLTHKGLISTRNMSGRGYPRIIVVEEELEDPESLTHVEYSK